MMEKFDVEKLRELQKMLVRSHFAPTAFSRARRQAMPPVVNLNDSGIASFLVECAQECPFPIEWTVEYDPYALSWVLVGVLPGYGLVKCGFKEDMFVLLRRHQARPQVKRCVLEACTELVLKCGAANGLDA